jgi:integrase
MLISSYLARLTLANYRPRTIVARRNCLTAFQRHLGTVALADATRQHVEAYLARPLAPESRRAYRSHLRAFFAWLTEEGLITNDPTAKLPAIRVPRAVPRPIGDAELTVALGRADARMKCWLLLMSLAGLRCCEVAALSPRDVMLTEAGVLLFLSECKGGGQATMPCHPAVAAALAALPIRDGQWWEVSPQHVSREVSVFLASCGIRATAHQMRHYAGTAWYKASGHDLLATAQLLRHANVATSQTYAQLDPVRPAEVVGLVRLAA